MERIVLFDGVCHLCDNAVNFIIRHDRSRRVRFAPLQSRVGREWMMDRAVTRVEHH
jgi:predicted DCC family thiol-disulfide oxidoreductase YuxK